MPNYNDTGMSDLEREFELEMEGNEGESGQDEELESDWEAQGDEEADEKADKEWENEPVETGGYAERFYELSQREFESESELDNEVRGIVNEMERDFFFGKWKNWRNRFKRMLKAGVGQLAGQIPGFKAIQALTKAGREALKGNLSSAVTSAIAAGLSAHPAGAAALPALKALGFEATGDSESNREAWNNYVEVAREAFDYLGRNLDERTADPLEASRMASNAFQSAVRKVQARVGSREVQVRDHRGRTMTIKVRKGERIIIEGI